ncbi:MAG: hypothetical protein V4678_03090 [Patescibacteria group bacterium]
MLLDLRRDAREEVVDALQIGLASQLLEGAVVGRDGGQALQVPDVSTVAAVACGCAHMNHLL